MNIIPESSPTGHTPFSLTPQFSDHGPHPDLIRELVDQVRVLLVDGEVLELTALDVSNSDIRRPHIRAGFFDLEHLDDAVREALAMSGCARDGKPAKAVYMNLNHLNKDVLARRCNRVDVAGKGDRVSDGDVVHRNWMMFDFDPKRLPEISATDLEKARAKGKMEEVTAFLQSRGWPDPVIADSGNGFHAYYRIDLPNDKEATDLVRDSINAIADRFNNSHVEVDRKVFDASRITKFPGTYARKGDSTLERPHRQSRLLSVPKGIQIVPPEMLRDLVATLGKTTKVGGHTKVTPAVASQVLKVPARDPVPTPNGEIVAASQHLLKAIPPAVSGEGGHDRCFHAACTVVQGFNLGVEDGLAAMEAWNQTCQPPWSEPELRHKLQDASKKADEEAAQPNGQRRGWLLEPNRRTRSDSADPVLDLRLNDVGNAQRFAEQHCADVRYCWLQRTWYVFDGCRWKSDSSGEIDRRAKATAESIGEEIAAAGGDANRRLVGKWAADSHSERHIRNMISLARSERVLQVAPEQFDQDRMLFNVRNGTVDLRTGRLRPHTRTDYITKLANVDYDAAAVCPRWEQFLNEIMGGNAGLVSFLNRAIGHSLTGDVSEQVIFIGHGTGANGKSTFLKLLLNLMGDYGRQAAPDLLLAKRGERHPTEIADLFGSRFTAAVEAEDNRQLAEALVKQLTGGDKRKARRMREDYWEYEGTDKIWLSVNHLPIIRGTDYGIWRRIRTIPFNVCYPDGDPRRDPNLPEKLTAELPGILNWAIRGCLEWQMNRLQPPPEVMAATAGYKQAMDLVGDFIDDYCVLQAGLAVPTARLRQCYVEYCKDMGLHPLNPNQFAEQLQARGCWSARGTGGRRNWNGIGIRVGLP